MSYSSEALLTKDEITNLMANSGWCDVIVKQIEYKRFKSNHSTSDKILYEYLFCAKKT